MASPGCVTLVSVTSITMGLTSFVRTAVEKRNNFITHYFVAEMDRYRLQSRNLSEFYFVRATLELKFLPLWRKNKTGKRNFQLSTQSHRAVLSWSFMRYYLLCLDYAAKDGSNYQVCGENSDMRIFKWKLQYSAAYIVLFHQFTVQFYYASQGGATVKSVDETRVSVWLFRTLYMVASGMRSVSWGALIFSVSFFPLLPN